MASPARRLLPVASKAIGMAVLSSSSSSSSSATLNNSSPTSFISVHHTTGSYLLSHSCVKPPTAILILLVATVFLLAFFFLYLRRCYLSQDNEAHPNIHLPHPSLLSLAGGDPDSTIRVLPQAGLHTTTLESLPKLIFSSSPTPNMTQTDCAICLDDFEEEETLRLLPPCGHVFHPDCIHMWLLSNTSCPLCRHPLLPPPLTKAISPPQD